MNFFKYNNVLFYKYVCQVIEVNPRNFQWYDTRTIPLRIYRLMINNALL
jgi:hypothetical protein